MAYKFNHIPWSHHFFVDAANRDIQGELRQKISEWCGKNCTQQWAIYYVSNGWFYSPSSHRPPLHKNYEPSQLSLYSGVIVSFQDEEEAMAFKLAFIEEN